MNNIHHTYGPPGTGKTSYLVNEANQSVRDFGIKSVLICSLTRAAAKEIGSRVSQVDEDMVGTLHSHAFRALGSPELVSKHINEWNDYCKMTHMRLSAKASEDGVGSSDGDQTLLEITLFRSRMTPRDEWCSTRCEAFFRKWNAWKEETGYLDFTDLIEQAILDVSKPPGDPIIMLGDEAQDWSKLEAKLFRDTWGKHVKKVSMVGDEDQTIFSWRGSDPHIFSGHPVPEENEKVLSQSYRVPKRVHQTAQQWIRQIKNRKDVEYHPKVGEIGEVRKTSEFIYKDPGNLMAVIDGNSRMGEKSMILCSCAYMLKELIEALRIKGIPFHNPYRVANRWWNPLQSRTDATSTMDRLKAFFCPDQQDEIAPWSKEAMKLWIPLLNSKDLLKPGFKTMADEGHYKLPETMADWGWIFKSLEDAKLALARDKEWLRANMMAAKKKVIDYPMSIIDNEMQDEEPLVTIGTGRGAIGNDWHDPQCQGW
jgi:superfamily I DNA/RNA helicase